MKNAFQTRILAVVLAAATLGACVLAGLNFASESDFNVPTDGVWWTEVAGGLCAQQVPSDSPGQRAGIRVGDILQSVDEHPTPRVSAFTRQIFRDGTYGTAVYSIARPITRCELQPTSTKFPVRVYLALTDRSINYGLRLIALVYLCIGLYVLFRRWTAPKSTHFYVFCLASFVLYAFRYTSQFDTLDWIVYWCTIVVSALQPALFLHFAFSFSDSLPAIQRHSRGAVLAILVYLPGIYLVALQVVAILRWSATEALRHRLDKIALGYMAIYYVW